MFRNAMKFLALSVILTAGAANATNPVEIDHCNFNISQPGHYKVVADLQCAQNEPYAIRISNTQNSEVDLDLNGHRLRGFVGSNGFQYTIGLFLHNARRVEIKSDRNGAELRGFQTAIQLWDQNRDVEIEGRKILVRDSASGLQIRNSRDVTVRRMRFQNNRVDQLTQNSQEVTVSDLNDL
ncbi:MAG: hypothetical protein H6617_07995 [Bdellovibrionaceae bacterium]|nr:hypothetical protein [Pseudobdellovibrionaceae bacterium]